MAFAAVDTDKLWRGCEQQQHWAQAPFFFFFGKRLKRKFGSNFITAAAGIILHHKKVTEFGFKLSSFDFTIEKHLTRF